MGVYTLRTGASAHPEDSVLQTITDLIKSSGLIDISGDQLQVVEQASPDMTVKVNDGRAYIKGTTGNAYPVRVDTDTNVAISANASGNDRIDVLILYIDKSAAADDEASNVAKLYVVEGTPAGSPVAPDNTAIQADIGASNPYILLAEIEVANGASSITNSEITDSRSLLSLEIPSGLIMTERTAPDTPATGQVKLYAKSDGKVYAKNDAGTEQGLVTEASKIGLYHNALINGNMDIWQRLNADASLTATGGKNNDDTYIMDRWILLSDGNDIVDISNSGDKPAGSAGSAKFVVQTANKQFGILQIIEGKNAKILAGKSVSLSFQAKTASGKEIENLRALVLAWNSTEDSLTSDVISSWPAEGADPTLVANWTKENSGSNLALTNSWQKFEIENIPLNTSGLTNLAVLIYVDDKDCAVNDELYITQVLLNEGTTSLEWQPTDWQTEYEKCLRYYEQSWGHGIAQRNSQGFHVSNTNGYIQVFARVSKRIRGLTSNISIYNGTTLNQVRNTNTGGTLNVGWNGEGMSGQLITSLYDLGAFTANTYFDYNFVWDVEL